MIIDLPRVTLLTGPTPLQRIAPRLVVKREDQSAPMYGGVGCRALEWVLGSALESGGDVLTAGRIGSGWLLGVAVHGRRLGVRVQAIPLPDQDTPQVREQARALHAWAEKLWPARSLQAGAIQAARAWASVRLLGGFRPERVFPGGGARGVLGGWAGGLELAEQILSGQADAGRSGQGLPERLLLPGEEGAIAVGFRAGLAMGGLSIPVLVVGPGPPLAFLQALHLRLLALLREHGAARMLRVGPLLREEPTAAQAAAWRRRGMERAREAGLPEDADGGMLAGRALEQPDLPQIAIWPGNGQPMAPLLAGALPEVPASLLECLRAGERGNQPG